MKDRCRIVVARQPPERTECSGVVASEREQLQGIGKSRSLPNGIVRRARMVLMSVDEVSNTQIAAADGHERSAGKLLARAVRRAGIAGLHGRCVRAPADPTTTNDRGTA